MSPQLAEAYIPRTIAGRLRSQSIKVWIISSLVVLGWLLLILGAPVLKASGYQSISTPIYHFFSYLCHQMPSRSFFVDGEQFAVCSRCFGVYLGLVLGFLVYPLWRPIDEIEPIPRFWLFLSLVPIGVDWSLGVFGIWENTFATRLITGLILGLACATFMMPALVEITRNVTRIGDQRT